MDKYPLEPPKVHFWSFGERLNPNLYESGKVCLSLLGTWSGDQNEQWNPAKSSILQVLVSLQALVLVDEPYFNEPGHETDRGTEEGTLRSKQYCEHARVLSLRSVIRMYRRPPAGLEEIVQVSRASESGDWAVGQRSNLTARADLLQEPPYYSRQAGPHSCQRRDVAPRYHRRRRLEEARC